MLNAHFYLAVFSFDCNYLFWLCAAFGFTPAFCIVFVCTYILNKVDEVGVNHVTSLNNPILFHWRSNVHAHQPHLCNEKLSSKQQNSNWKIIHTGVKHILLLHCFTGTSPASDSFGSSDRLLSSLSPAGRCSCAHSKPGSPRCFWNFLSFIRGPFRIT